MVLYVLPGSSKYRTSPSTGLEPTEDLEPLIDAPENRNGSRVNTPVRKKAVKRRNIGIHGEEPETKVIICDADDAEVAMEAGPVIFDTATPILQLINPCSRPSHARSTWKLRIVLLRTSLCVRLIVI